MEFTIPSFGNRAAEEALLHFVRQAERLLGDNIIAVYLHGSAAMHDFRPGWSDLDLLILTKTPLSRETADALVCLRQTCGDADVGNPFYRAIEGAILPADAFVQDGRAPHIVYYGTSGQRVTDHFDIGVLSRAEWYANGILLSGKELRHDPALLPTYEDCTDAVEAHLQTSSPMAASRRLPYIPMDGSAISAAVFIHSTGAEFSPKPTLCGMPKRTRPFPIRYAQS